MIKKFKSVPGKYIFLPTLVSEFFASTFVKNAL